MKRYRINEDKLLRNIAIISGLASGVALIVKVATCGISWISTIGYLG